MNKIQLGLLSAACFVIAALLVVQHNARTEYRDANLSMQQQLEQATAENDRLSNLLIQARAPNALSEEQMSELLKLRSEVQRLRLQQPEVQKSRPEPLAQAVAVTNAAPSQAETATHTEVNSNYFPRESLTFAGYNDPRAALQTTFWALTKGDFASYSASLTPDEKARLEKNLTGDGRTGSEFAAQVARSFQNVKNVGILDQQVVSDNQVILNIYAHGGDQGPQKARFNRVGGQWKFDGWAEP